jgi:hypothetical protein
VPMSVSHEPGLSRRDVQHRADLVPAEVADLDCPQAVALGEEHYGGVTMAAAVAPGHLDQGLDLAGTIPGRRRTHLIYQAASRQRQARLGERSSLWNPWALCGLSAGLSKGCQRGIKSCSQSERRYALSTIPARR